MAAVSGIRFGLGVCLVVVLLQCVVKAVVLTLAIRWVVLDVLKDIKEGGL
jgi:hypothetical protein